MSDREKEREREEKERINKTDIFFSELSKKFIYSSKSNIAIIPAIRVFNQG